MRVLIIFLGILFVLTSTSCATRVVSHPRKVTIVKRPANYKLVRVKGKKYYMWNGRYYKKTKRGYIVVKI